MRNKEKDNEKARARYKLNSEAKKARVKLYKQQNAEHIKLKNKAYRKKRKETDPLYKFTENIRKLIINSFKRKNSTKQSKTSLIIGCSFIELKQHIENQFEPWMNWGNRGISSKPKIKWQIDHIIPLATANTVDDIIRLNHYTNLRPLCAKENRDKWDKI